MFVFDFVIWTVHEHIFLTRMAVKVEENLRFQIMGETTNKRDLFVFLRNIEDPV